jgi:hypothetical protein
MAVSEGPYISLCSSLIAAADVPVILAVAHKSPSIPLFFTSSWACHQTAAVRTSAALSQTATHKSRPPKLSQAAGLQAFSCAAQRPVYLEMGRDTSGLQVESLAAPHLVIYKRIFLKTRSPDCGSRST